MLQKLFTSRTRVKLLTLFLMNPDREMYVREITRNIGENINSVRRELANLEEIGLLTSKRKGNLTAIPVVHINAYKRGTVSLLFRKHFFTIQISHERWYNLKQLE